MSEPKPVGYKSPPVHSRFKTGRSGNPSGRPKRPKPLLDDLQTELAERVEVTESGRRRRLTKQVLILKRLIADAARGDVRASGLILRLLERVTPEVAEASPAKLTSDDQTLLDEYVERELRRRQTREGGAQ